MVRIYLHSSRHLMILIGLAHGGAAAVALVVDLPGVAQLLIMLSIAASCVNALRGPALLRAVSSITALELGEDGKLSIQTRQGDWCAATLLESSFVGPYLTVLSLRTEKSRFAHHAVIMADSLNGEDFRKLRVWLRWRKASA
ncbi:MAG: protein YgfX [Betaproteobacteria bacterium]